MDFRIGNTFVTETWGRIEIVDIHPAIIQVEQDSKGQFWVSYSDLVDEISGKRITNEEPRLQLQRSANRRQSRRSHPLQETDAYADPEG